MQFNVDSISFLVIAVFIGILVFSYFYEKKRSKQLHLLATSIGLSFDKFGRTQTFKKLQNFRLFNQGRSKKIKNEMWGQYNGNTLIVFGYQYTTGSGKNSSTHKQTVVAIESNNFNCPAFYLEPENFLHKISEVFGQRDIDFDSNPNFSKNYYLKASNEHKVREIFTSEIIHFFEKNKNYCVEIQDSTLLIYKKFKRSNANEIKALMSKTEEIHNLFSIASRY